MTNLATNLVNNLPTEQNEVDRLARRLASAKAEEEKAKRHRLAIEEEIIELCGVSVEGSTTFKGDEFNIVTTGKITRTIDAKALEAAWDQIPDEARLAISYKPQLIKKEFDALKKLYPSSLPSLLSCITEKPAKPAVSVKALGV